MDSKSITALNELITLERGSTSFQIEEIPSELIDSPYLDSELRPPSTCLNMFCEDHIDWTVEGDSLVGICDQSHECETSVNEHTYYSINFGTVLEDIADHLGLNPTDYSGDNLPRFVSLETENEVDIFLIVSPNDYEGAANSILLRTLSSDQPALLLTPEEQITDLLEVQSLFASGHLVYSLPFTLLSEPEHIRKQIDTILSIKGLETRLMSERHSGDATPLVGRLNSNPRYILTELNEMKLLRMNQEIRDGVGTRLEKVAEAAISHLFPTYPDTGGEDSSGEKLPDTVYRIGRMSPREDYDTILGILDTKSGQTGNFGREKTVDKHSSYLDRARRESISADCIAHTFLVLGFDGHQEISFFDQMEYRDGEYLLIFTDNGLSAVLAAYLSFVVSNELRLKYDDFRKAIYPLFHNDSFNELGLSSITRRVGRDQDGYDSEYAKRPKLMVVTDQVVFEHLENCMDQEGDIERILASYFRPEIYTP